MLAANFMEHDEVSSLYQGKGQLPAPSAPLAAHFLLYSEMFLRADEFSLL
jgi:hypothetical protein